MKSHTEYLWFNTKQKTEFINITGQIEKIVEKAGIKEGFCLVSAMHTTAGIWVNDAESGLLQDIKEWAEKLVPFKDYTGGAGTILQAKTMAMPISRNCSLDIRKSCQSQREN